MSVSNILSGTPATLSGTPYFVGPSGEMIINKALNVDYEPVTNVLTIEGDDNFGILIDQLSTASNATLVLSSTGGNGVRIALAGQKIAFFGKTPSVPQQDNTVPGSLTPYTLDQVVAALQAYGLLA